MNRNSGYHDTFIEKRLFYKGIIWQKKMNKMQLNFELIYYDWNTFHYLF